MILLKSRLYREEILRWILIVVLALWATSATVWALSVKREIILIGLDETGARLITDKKDKLLEAEALAFIQAFAKHYLNYNESTFDTEMGLASDFLSADLWERKKADLVSLREKLKREPLTQNGEIESIDLTGELQYEVVTQVRIRRRLVEANVRLRLRLSLERRERSTSNQWAYEIKEMQDESL